MKKPQIYKHIKTNILENGPGMIFKDAPKAATKRNQKELKHNLLNSLRNPTFKDCFAETPPRISTGTCAKHVFFIDTRKNDTKRYKTIRNDTKRYETATPAANI